MHVAYLLCIYSPLPSLDKGGKYSSHFAFTYLPPFCLKFMSITNLQPCYWSHAGPILTALLQLILHSLYIHTHSLSLSPSLSSSGIITIHTAPHPALHIVMPQSGSEPRFGPELLRTGPKSGPKSGMGPELNLKSGSRFGSVPRSGEPRSD